MATKSEDKAPASAPDSAPVPATRYRVLSGGISTPIGAIYRDALVTDAELGDADRVAKLLARKAIEVVGD